MLEIRATILQGEVRYPFEREVTLASSLLSLVIPARSDLFRLLSLPNVRSLQLLGTDHCSLARIATCCPSLTRLFCWNPSIYESGSMPAVTELLVQQSHLLCLEKVAQWLGSMPSLQTLHVAGKVNAWLLTNIGKGGFLSSLTSLNFQYIEFDSGTRSVSQLRALVAALPSLRSLRMQTHSRTLEWPALQRCADQQSPRVEVHIVEAPAHFEGLLRRLQDGGDLVDWP